MFKQIEIFLSKLKTFKNPKIKLEQYPTPSTVIKEFLIFIEQDLINLIENKLKKGEKLKIMDCCCGTGFLGISIILFYYFNDYDLNNLEITFLDIDKDIFPILEENLNFLKKEFDLDSLNFEFINKNIFDFKISEKFDLVVLNPPFGIQGKIKDIDFIKKSLEIGKLVISFHLKNSLNFLMKNFNVLSYKTVKFEIKQQFWFHNRRKKFIDVIIVKFC